MSEARLPTLTEVTMPDGTVRPLADEWGDFLNKGFLAVPNRLLRRSMGIDPLAKLVLITLMSWCTKADPGKPVRRNGKPIRVSHLVEWTGLGRTAVKRCLTTLHNAEYIAVRSDAGEPNEYLILHVNIMNALSDGG